MKKNHLFNITEMWRSRKEEYSLVMTDDEMKKYLKGKRDVNGYIPGVAAINAIRLLLFMQFIK